MPKPEDERYPALLRAVATAPDEPAIHAAVTAARVGRYSWAFIGSALSCQPPPRH